MLIYAKKLKPHERLFINRRRLGKTQVQMARKLKVSVHTYRQWERSAEMNGVPVTTSIGKLTEQEQCVILRRRKSISVEHLAKKLKCCKQWLRDMERGNASIERLFNYWKKR